MLVGHIDIQCLVGADARNRLILHSMMIFDLKVFVFVDNIP